MSYAANAAGEHGAGGVSCAAKAAGTHKAKAVSCAAKAAGTHKAKAVSYAANAAGTHKAKAVSYFQCMRESLAPITCFDLRRTASKGSVLETLRNDNDDNHRSTRSDLLHSFVGAPRARTFVEALA